MPNEILIFETEERQIEVQLDSQHETLWLSQKQLAELLDTSPDNISLHLKNIYEDNELEQDSTTEDFSVVRQEGNRQVKRQLKHYNLDAIISVGYRVNSKKGTQFRQWATARLNEHLVQANLPEAQGLVKVIAEYANTFVLLNQFDSERLPTADFEENIRYQIDYEEARAAIALLVKSLIAKGEATDLVGNEKDDSFAGVLGSVVQSFGGEYLYPSIEAQAAHLLYFIIKNHPFSDGNKRIGAFMFIWFLQRNEHHLK